jgi:excisionase family DNA binding protein
MIEKMMTADEVAECLHVAKATIYSWTCGKKITFIKIGGQLLFKESEIMAFIDGKTIKAL